MALEYIYGVHPVEELLRAGRREVRRLLIAGSPRGSITQLAIESSVPIEQVEKSRLNSLADHHQNVIAEVGPYPYSDLVAIKAGIEAASNRALVLILDQLQDPQNFGTLIRTAEAVGVEGVLIPKKGAAGISPAVVSASSGASEHLLIARANLAQAMVDLKASDIWIAGLEASSEARSIYAEELRPPLAIVVGAEGKGLRRLVREHCDFQVQIPMQGKVDSLNAAVAGSIALFMARRSSETAQ